MRPKTLKHDVAASLVVFLVAVPLALGIALASGAPLAAGLLAAAAGGLVGGALGGAPLMVSGPAAGLAVIVFDLVQRFGFPVLCTITLAAGLCQVGLGLARIARYATAIAPAVLHGMLAGIGLSLAAAQLHVLLGGSPQSAVWRNLAALPAALGTANGAAAALGGLTLALLLLWPRVPALRRLPLPPPLVSVLAATLLGAVWGAEVPHVALGEGLLTLRLPALPHGQWPAALGAVLTITLVASAESLLSAVAVDKLHGGARADLDRELIGQGAANVASGLIGGLPVTGVVVRSTANIEAGARTRAASMLHGLWIVLAAWLAQRWLSLVPLSALAALLIYVGLKLINPREVRALQRHGEAGVYAVTVAGVVGINLLAGIGMGIALSVLRLALRLGAPQMALERRAQGCCVRIRGPLCFVAVPRLSQLFAAVPAGGAVALELDGSLVDHAAEEALQNFAQSHRATGGTVSRTVGSHVPPPVARTQPADRAS